MKVNIYYGGRGLLDDPTLYVLNKMEEVLQELRVTVERINIYEHKNEIATLPQTMKDADGIILATTVEWLGIGFGACFIVNNSAMSFISGNGVKTGTIEVVLSGTEFV